MAAVEPLLKARMAIEQQVGELDRKVMKLARDDAQVHRLMTMPGVGPITALCIPGNNRRSGTASRDREVWVPMSV